MPEQPNYASLVVLSYKRPEFVLESIRSATENAGYPCEVIVVDDGSDSGVQMSLLDLLAGGQISKLVAHVPGHNEGVGRGFNEGAALATGDPVLKLDQDLLYERDWLARVVGILNQDKAVGMLGLFKYHHEPVIWSDKKINVPTRGGYHYTRQFCGSGFAIPRRVWDQLGPLGEYSDAFCEDSEFMDKVRTSFTPGLELALPDIDLVTNRGFGIGPSTVVEEGYVVHKIHHGPFLVGASVEDPVEDPVLDSEALADLEKLAPLENGVISPSRDEHLGTGAAEPAGPFEYDWTLPPEVIEGATRATEEAKERRFDVGVVITTCQGREANLLRTLDFVGQLDRQPRYIVVVCDGCSPDTESYKGASGYDALTTFEIPKHTPGQEQPRNVGFRRLREDAPECNYVWFLDSDLIVPSDCLQRFYEGLCAADEDRILIGPYDWLAPGVVDFGWDLQNDPRWISFDEHGPEKVLVHDLGAALANFAGNLIWPVDAFEQTGGFHPDLHHGRCEDGELGLRAASQGVPMSFVRGARGWHVWHSIDLGRVHAANSRDVPLINRIHPWVEGQGLLVTAEDGARFEWKCPRCSKLVNSLEYWNHERSHRMVNY